MCCPVLLDELVFDYPVDLPGDGAEVPCPDRVQRPLPCPEDAPGDRIRAALAREVPRLGQVLALDVERAHRSAVRQPHPAAPGYVAPDLTDGLHRLVHGHV